MTSTGPGELGRHEVLVEIIQNVIDGEHDISDGGDRILNHVRLNTSLDW